ncbi:MAG: SMC family ATPase [Bacteroidetes bacterium]|nr:MAG: SMC family ATPase [Bacteroidota bacterium]
MILRALHLEHYKQYNQLDLEFRDGLVGIIGRNGSGKSTLFEAILYCLYGKDERNKNLIRSSFADPKATVVLALRFVIGAAEYEVKREFRGKAMSVNAELYKNDDLIAKGVAAVNDEVVRVLNMERDAFKRSVFSGQKELSELSDTSGEARKRMVRKMLGLDTLDDIQSRVNADSREISSQITGQRQNLLDPEVSKVLEADIKAQTKLYKENNRLLKQEQKQLKTVEAEHRKAREDFEAETRKQTTFNQIQQEVSRLQERLEGIRNRLASLQEKSTELEAQQKQLAAQQKQFAGYEQEKKQLRELEQLRQKHLNRDAYLVQLQDLEPMLQESRQRLSSLDKALKAGQETEQKLAVTQKEAAEADKAIEEKRESYEQIKRQIGALGVRVEERRNKIESLRAIGKTGTCPTCFQPVLEAYDQVLAHLNEEINALQGETLAKLEQQKETIKLEGLQLRNRQTSIRQALDNLLAENTRFQEIRKQRSQEAQLVGNYETQITRIQVVLKEIGEVQFDTRQFEALQEKTAATEPLYLQYRNDLAYVNKELPATRSAYKAALEEQQKTEKLLRENTHLLEKTEYEPAAYEKAKNALSTFGDAFSAQSSRVRALEKTGIEMNSGIEQKKEKLRVNAQIQEQIGAKQAEVELLKKLTELLLQFKTEILERVSPSISREASDLFSRITKGKYDRIHVDENFDFFIADGGMLYPIERFSGGEIDLANFCLRIAITKAIVDLSGNGQGVEFLAFDEIFGSQDEERRHEMMLALHYLQEQFRQIYIVSHIDSQKDYFPNLLEVTYHPDGSVTKWV